MAKMMMVMMFALCAVTMMNSSVTVATAQANAPYLLVASR